MTLGAGGRNTFGICSQPLVLTRTDDYLLIVRYYQRIDVEVRNWLQNSREYILYVRCTGPRLLLVVVNKTDQQKNKMALTSSSIFSNELRPVVSMRHLSVMSLHIIIIIISHHPRCTLNIAAHFTCQSQAVFVLRLPQRFNWIYVIQIETMRRRQ